MSTTYRPAYRVFDKEKAGSSRHPRVACVHPNASIRYTAVNVQRHPTYTPFIQQARSIGTSRQYVRSARRRSALRVCAPTVIVRQTVNKLPRHAGILNYRISSVLRSGKPSTDCVAWRSRLRRPPNGTQTACSIGRGCSIVPALRPS